MDWVVLDKLHMRKRGDPMTDQDLVARLRACDGTLPHERMALCDTCDEAADAIERLTAEVAELKAYVSELSMSLADRE